MTRCHSLLAGTVGAVLAITACSGGSAPAPSTTTPVATVATVVLGTGRVDETLETYGRVEPDPKRLRTVAFVAAGQVGRVLVMPGQSITAGTELLTLGALPAASLEVQQAQIELEYARREVERLRRLRANQLATNEQVQQAEKAAADAAAALAAMGAPDDADAAPDRTTLAPFAGVVREVLVTAGAVVHAGEPAVLLAPADAVVVRAGFEAEDLDRLETGLPATVEPLLDAGTHAPVAGTVAALHRVVDPDTQLVEVVVEPATVPAWLLAGATVRVRVAVRSTADAVVVPRDALLARDGRHGVFVVTDGAAHWTPIDLGLEGPDVVAATGGVAVGDRVVTTGRSVLSDGMAVTEAGAGGGA